MNNFNNANSARRNPSIGHETVMQVLDRIRLWIVLAGCLALSAGAAYAAEPGSAFHTSEALGAVYKQYGASQAVRAGNFLFIGGIVAMADDGSTIAPHDGAAQAEIIYGYIAQLLAAHGADARNVVSESLYVANYDEYWKGAPVRQKFYDDAGAAYPSTVGFQVVKLSADDYVFEVHLTAYVGSDVATQK